MAVKRTISLPTDLDIYLTQRANSAEIPRSDYLARLLLLDRHAYQRGAGASAGELHREST